VAKARPAIPDPLERRHLLERELDAATARGIAEAYLAEERGWDAIAFLQKAGARDLLEQLRDQAVRAGDAFLLREAARALGEDPGAEQWRALGEAARAAGKERYTALASRQVARANDRAKRTEG
jgi:hypothetical protein